MAKLKDGYYKQTAEAIGSDLHVLLAGGGSKALSDFAYKSDLTGFVTGGPYLPTAGGTITGTLKIYRDAAAINYCSSGGTSHGWLGFSEADVPRVWLSNGSTSYPLLHTGNYSGYLDGRYYTETEVNNLLSNYLPINGTAAAASKLTSTKVFGFGASAATYCKVASINITGRYGGGSGLLKFYTNRTISTETYFADSFEVFVHAYQQNPIGEKPVLQFKSTNTGDAYDIIGILNYSSSGSTFDIYAYGKGRSYHGLHVTLVYGDITIAPGSYVSSLPAGTQVTPLPMGNAKLLNGFTDSAFWKKTELTKVSQLTNDSGYVTGGPYLPLSGGTIRNGATRNPLTIDTTNTGGYINFALDGVLGAFVGYNNSLGAFIETADGATLLLKGSNITFNYNKVWHAGNDGTGSGLDADLLDGYHENSFLRYRDLGSNGGATLWDQIGIRSYHNALPEGLSGIYNFGQVVSLPGYGSRLDIFTNHLGSSQSDGQGGLWWRSGWNSDKHIWRRIIDSGNIGSQHVKTADKISHSTYYYGGNVMKNDTSAYTIFGDNAKANYLFPSFMQSHPVWNDWADVLNFTGYCKWGGTQIATEYNAIKPRIAIRKFNQSRDNWGDWTEFITSGNLTYQVGDWNSSVLSVFKSSENQTSNAPTQDFCYGVHLRFHRDTANYFTDLVTTLYSDNLYYRRHTENGYSSWKRLAFVEDVPTSLKNPSAIKFKNASGVEVSYDGSAAVDLTGGVNYASIANLLNTVTISEADFNKSPRSGFYNVTKASTTTLPGTVTSGNIAIHACWDNGVNTAALDFLINDSTSSNLYYRASVGGQKGSWKTVFDSSNYTSYTVKKDGTGASGTWGINISGTAAHATSASALACGSFDTASQITTAYAQWANNSGCSDVPSMGYAAVLNVGYGNYRWWQIWNSRNDHQLYWRPEKSDASGWADVHILIDNKNISNYLPVVTNYYWADQLITNSAKSNATPTFGSVVSTGLITAQSGVQIGSTSDIGWYFYNSRICAGNSVARGVNTGSLLVSSAWADDSKVPTNGIYSKGNIITPANVQALNLNLHGDWETDFGINLNEGGDTKYGFSLLYGNSDLFKLVTRNDGTASTVFSVGRGSTQVDFKGKVTVANRLYPKEWIQFDNATGLYWPNTNGAHFYPNETSTYGQFQLLGTKNSYSGIHFGNSKNYLTVMSTDTHHGLYCENYGWEFYFNRSNSYVGLRTSSTPYPISMSGDSYTTGWSRAASGFYIEGTGVHFTNQGSLGEIDMISNNEFLWGSSSADLYFNYRAVSRGTTVTTYRWHAGSSTSYASHVLGKVKAQSTASSWLDGQRYERGGFNLMDATDTGSYWPWMRQTNTGSSKWFSMGVLGSCLYFIGSATSRTENSYDYGFRMDFSNGYLYGNFSGYLNGTAAKASYLDGFSSGGTASQTWGNQTGTGIHYENDSTGGSFEFRRDNPSSGKVSLKVDGRVYVSEGTYPVISSVLDGNGYPGLLTPDGTSNWIRVSNSASYGLLPNQSGEAGSGHGYLGTSSWYFKYAYIDQIYGYLNGSVSGSAGYTTRLYANSDSNLITAPGEYSLAYSRFQSNASNIFPVSNNANGCITAHLHNGNYFAQIGLSSDGRMYYRTMIAQALDAGVAWNKVAWTSDIPSVGNGTVTITQNGANMGSFTMNQSGNTTIALTDTDTDTNTWRPVQCNGTSIGSNTLNLKPGSNVSLSNSSGAITITATDTNYYPVRYYTSGLQISTNTGSDNCSLYVPYATTSQAGVVSTADQSFKGNKTFTKINSIDPGYLLFYAGRVYKKDGSTSASSTYGMSGFSIAVTKLRAGAYQVKVTNTTGRSCYIHPMLSPVFANKGEGSCYEHGFAYFSSGDSYMFPVSLSTGVSITFTIICGYMHTQGNWSSGDFTKSNDGGGFTCEIFATWSY